MLPGAIFWLFCAERRVRPARVCNECAKKRTHIGERENSEGVCFQREEVVRPGGLELPTFWFVASQPTLPNLARAYASEAKSVSSSNSWQFTFSFSLLVLFAH